MTPTQTIAAALELIEDPQELQRISAMLAERMKANHRRLSALNLSTISVGDRVRLVNIRPKYMTGALATVVELARGGKLLISIDGRSGVSSVPASCVEKVSDAATSAKPIATPVPAPATQQRADRERALLTQIANCYASLSPENLSCDGELSAATVAKRRASIKAQLDTLFNLLGRRVDEREAFAARELFHALNGRSA